MAVLIQHVVPFALHPVEPNYGSTLTGGQRTMFRLVQHSHAPPQSGLLVE